MNRLPNVTVLYKWSSIGIIIGLNKDAHDTLDVMNIRTARVILFFLIVIFGFTNDAYADALTLTSGSSVTTTQNVATSIPGFQIVGPGEQTTPVKLRATQGTLNVAVVSGVTMSGNNTSTVSLSGTVSNLNTALATLKYTRATLGSDTLEVSLVEVAEVFFENNGHLYQYISDAGNWNDAKTKAEALTRYGATGYLATITSSAENAFVTARLGGAGWMGAGDMSNEGVWRWVTGPESGTQFWSGTGSGGTVGGNYANWNSGEPNNSGEEDCAQFLAGGTGMWNDLPCGSFSLPGYVAEFGASGNMPVVVAQNISITTANVPALTTLSPANGATSVDPETVLVVGLSKTVTAETGSILIRKVSDDSIVETIDVAGGTITGSGTTSITITPSAPLAEGTSYYVTIPNTAFKDSSNNFFEGITSDTVWTFTTSDTTAPVITEVASVPTETTASISWTTNELASTQVEYSVDDSYSADTAVTNTSPGVLSHEVQLSGLLSCTNYKYKVISEDSFNNSTTSESNNFYTTGCPAGSTPASTAAESIDPEEPVTTTLATGGQTLAVTPATNFTNESSVVIQIKSMDALVVLPVIGSPSSASRGISDTVFDVSAIINGTTILDTFDAPITITYSYTDEDIVGITESTLKLYRYHAGSWYMLDGCAVDTGANTTTCTTQGFSVFALFGTPVATGSRSTGVSLETRIRALTQMGKTKDAQALALEFRRPDLAPKSIAVQPVVAPVLNTGQCATDTIITQNIKMGARDGQSNQFTKAVVVDVAKLQTHINRILKSEYDQAAGVVDGIFGVQTKQGVERLQRALNTTIKPPVPLIIDGVVGSFTRTAINNSCTI